jgi:pimeloyl-ACP methyl ester carboxylesterase
MPHIVFSHANSYPASTYRVLFDNLQTRGLEVRAIEKLGHNPRYPVSDNWPNLVQELIDFTREQVEQTGGPVWLVGHSMGGILSAMVAAQRPALVRGVVLLDAPLLGGWRATFLSLTKAVRLVGSLSPGSVSQQRRNRWPSVEQAFAHFRSKSVFASWNEQMLRDYVTHGTTQVQGERQLAFDRDIETDIYNTFPDDLDYLFRKHPIQCPVTYIGGRTSEEMNLVTMGLTRRITRGRIMMLDGSHLFPMEKPVATAAAIEAALHNVRA